LFGFFVYEGVYEGVYEVTFEEVVFAIVFVIVFVEVPFVEVTFECVFYFFATT
jgi:hypothetical protein